MSAIVCFNSIELLMNIFNRNIDKIDKHNIPIIALYNITNVTKIVQLVLTE